MEKQLTKVVVKQTMDLLITANGQATTLEIKMQLQSLNYFATQKMVHDFVEEIYAEYNTEYTRQPKDNGDVTYNVYSAVTDWETTVANNQKVTSNSSEDDDNDSELTNIIQDINAKTPMHKFHVAQSVIPGVGLVAQKDTSTGKTKIGNDEFDDAEDVTDQTKAPVAASNDKTVTAKNETLREPLSIYYTLAAFKKSNQDPNSWIVTDSEDPNHCEIHVYNKLITRDQARSRYASLHGFKIGRARCSKAANFKG